MKITTLILFVCLIQVSAATKAQITLNVKGAPLQKVLEDISTQSGYDFVYSIQDFKNAKAVDIKLDNVPLDKALRLCFEGQPLIYEISDKTVMVRKKEEKSVIDRVKDFFTGKDISGKVFGADGEVLEGATVTIKNSNKSTVTNQYGSFYLKDVAEDAIIVISYIGYKTIEVQPYLFVNGKLNIRLERGESKLDEVQVQAYGLTTRRLSTGDISTVKAADIEKQDVNNPLLALQGRVPGLLITPSSGMPGSPITVQIRGTNTLGKIGGIGGIGKTATPLFIIDGVPYSNNITYPRGSGSTNTGTNREISAFSFINPTDIESIDVLKDADATSIYGSRGANGVILITTKKGKIGTNDIDVGFSSGYGKVPKMLKLLNTQQYLEMRREAYKNDGLALPTTPSSKNYDLTVYSQDRYTDWQKELIGGTAKYTTAHATISGGSPNVQYVISGNFNRQGYVFPGDASYTSGTGHFSLSGNSLNNRFKATLTGSYTANSNTTATDFTLQAVALVPNAPAVYAANGSLNWQPNPNSGIGTWKNPYSALQSLTTANNKMLESSVSLSYQLLRSLTVKADMGFSDVRGDSFTANPTTAYDPEYVKLGILSAGSAFDNISSTSWNIDPQILYHVSIGRGRFDAIVGASVQGQSQGLQDIAALDYSSDALLGNLASAGTYYVNNASSQYKSEGIFGRLNYNWDDKYILNINARRDGSSRFGPKDQFGNFGSVGAAWIFSREAFIQKTLPFMSFGKLRFSYGTSGNDGIGDYAYLELYGYPQDNPTYQGTKGIVSGGVSNPYYHWEETRKAEIGLETGFFGDRILLGANYFRNRSDDQLGAFPLPATAGSSPNFLVNQRAKIQNSGWEFSLTTQNIKTKDFRWSTSAHLSLQRNKLLALPADGTQAYGLSPLTKPGDPFSGVTYVYQFKGVDPATGRYQFSAGKNGGLTFTPTNLSASTAISTTPQFYGGFSNSFSYKGFTLDVFLQFTKQMGRNFLYDNAFGLLGYPGHFDTGTGNLPAEVLKRWQKPGDIANIQRFTTGTSTGAVNVGGYSSAKNSTDAYVDASFIKIKNVSVSYSIPQTWKDKWGIKNLRVYLQGQNLWTITRYKGFDPETQSVSSLPQLRVLTAGIQAGF